MGMYPPAWLWAVAVAMTFAGLWFSRSLRMDSFIARLPGWFCALLALAGLVGMWWLLNAQFGGQFIQLRLL